MRGLGGGEKVHVAKCAKLMINVVWSEGTTVQPVKASVKIADASPEDKERWERLGFQNVR